MMSLQTLHDNISQTTGSFVHAVWYSHQSKHICRRAFDLAAVAVLSPVAIPLVAATALSIRFCNGQNPLFIQERVGYMGKPFNILKMRTYDDQGNLLKCAKTIRALKLDELPQLINIARGEMSMTGPRPHLAKEEISGLSWRHRDIPGVTGLGKIMGGNNIAHTDEALLDRVYQQKCNSMGLAKFAFYNASIIVRTPLAIWAQRRAPTSYCGSTELAFGKGSSRKERKAFKMAA